MLPFLNTKLKPVTGNQRLFNRISSIFAEKTNIPPKKRLFAKNKFDYLA
jgi:hypothetical protein